MWPFAWYAQYEFRHITQHRLVRWKQILQLCLGHVYFLPEIVKICKFFPIHSCGWFERHLLAWSANWDSASGRISDTNCYYRQYWRLVRHTRNMAEPKRRLVQHFSIFFGHFFASSALAFDRTNSLAFPVSLCPLKDRLFEWIDLYFLDEKLRWWMIKKQFTVHNKSPFYLKFCSMMLTYKTATRLGSTFADFFLLPDDLKVVIESQLRSGVDITFCE